MPAPYYDLLDAIHAEVEETMGNGDFLDPASVSISFCWNIGRLIADYSSCHGDKKPYASKLSRDLQRDHPSLSLFSAADVRGFESLYTAWSGLNETGIPANPPAELSKISWRHNRILLESLSDPDTRRWYASKAFEQQWTQTELKDRIVRRQIDRQGLTLHNFDTTLLSAGLAGEARTVFQDPYQFNYLELPVGAGELWLENALINSLRHSLPELGRGFAFVGNQVTIPYAGKRNRIDLLFFHLRLRCFIVIELKRFGREFDARFVSQIDRYIEAVDATQRHREDGPTIGIVLCHAPNRDKVLSALAQTNRPIGVADYLVENLPPKVSLLAQPKNSLPKR